MPEPSLSTGVHPHTAPTTYHRWSFDPDQPQNGPISCSLLKRWASLGPLMFKTDREVKQTPAMTWGSLVDCLLFTPDLYPREFVTKDDCPHLSADGAFRSKEAREWKKEKIESGATLIDLELKTQADLAVDRLIETPICAEILDGANFQVALMSETSGIPIKGLLDIVPAHLDHDVALADLKTTSINLYDDVALRRHVETFRYHWQAAFYLDLWNSLNPDGKRREFRLLFQSINPPYECRVVDLEEEWLAQGRTAVDFHLRRLIRALRTGMFVSPFRNKTTTIGAPGFYSEEAQIEMLEDIDS